MARSEMDRLVGHTILDQPGPLATFKQIVKVDRLLETGEKASTS